MPCSRAPQTNTVPGSSDAPQWPDCVKAAGTGLRRTANRTLWVSVFLSVKGGRCSSLPHRASQSHGVIRSYEGTWGEVRKAPSLRGLVRPALMRYFNYCIWPSRCDCGKAVTKYRKPAKEVRQGRNRVPEGKLSKVPYQ